ncbi:MAG: polymer-forming cytoskeletal protein [Bacteroidales bacterium]|nr:polymer-forming cytoskeletal protein [Bacteroidales bacterium]MCF6341175.1 polymer-forming cytoskeletal protein [Bacteroidales bacterium]
MRKNNGGTNGDGAARNIIALGTVINGDIVSDGDFRIEGVLTGTVKAKGKIVIGETGKIDGQVYCRNADICGKVKGKLEVAELTILKATSSFDGDIITNKISIEPGALFSGTCQMNAPKKEGVESKK